MCRIMGGFIWLDVLPNIISVRRYGKKIIALICVMLVIAKTISIGITVTNRYVYYCYKDVFGSKKV